MEYMDEFNIVLQQPVKIFNVIMEGHVLIQEFVLVHSVMVVLHVT